MRVQNIRDLKRGWQSDNRLVYIGRKSFSHGVGSSIWANPYRLGNDTIRQRESVVRDFTLGLLQQPELLQRVSELADKKLVCWCAPKLCHGDVLALLSMATCWDAPTEPYFQPQYFVETMYSVASGLMYAANTYRKARMLHADNIGIYAAACESYESAKANHRIHHDSPDSQKRLSARIALDSATDDKGRIGGNLIEARRLKSRAIESARQCINFYQEIAS